MHGSGLKTRIAIAGEGFGGLTLARILHRHGIDAVVYHREASRSPGPQAAPSAPARRGDATTR
ncbi:FAD-dependent monooxygenase [Micromonospora zamorensis]|uniref:FAD-dependent monooxygenase n=1 Tax=Micromonospora zamorensis TaxID=709883 RepID=UPI003999AB7E